MAAPIPPWQPLALYRKFQPKNQSLKALAMGFHRVCFSMAPPQYWNILRVSVQFTLWCYLISPKDSWAHLPSQLLVPPCTWGSSWRWEHSPAMRHPWCSLRHAPVTALRGRGVVGWTSPWPKLPSQISGNSTCSICEAFPECPLLSVLLICHYLNTSTVQGIRLTFCPENSLKWSMVLPAWWHICTENAKLTMAALLTPWH